RPDGGRPFFGLAVHQSSPHQLSSGSRAAAALAVTVMAGSQCPSGATLATTKTVTVVDDSTIETFAPAGAACSAVDRTRAGVSPRAADRAASLAASAHRTC